MIAYLPTKNAMQVANSFLSPVIPRQGAPMLEELFSAVSAHRTGMLSFGIIATLWLTSKGVKGIIAGLDMVYEVKTPRRVWTNRILAFALTFAVGVLLLLGVGLTLMGPFLASLLSRAFPGQWLWARFWPLIQWSFSAVSAFAAIELLYIFAPNVSARRRVTIPGALIASAIWLALSWGVGFYFYYFGAAKFDMFYGAMATPIMLAIWLNWGALGMLFGAEINLNIQSLRSSKEEATEVRPTRAA
jgi:membrane protein